MGTGLPRQPKSWPAPERIIKTFYAPTGQGKALMRSFLGELERRGIWPNTYNLGRGGVPEGTPELPDHPYGYLRSIQVDQPTYHFLWAEASPERARQRVAEVLGNPFGIGRAELIERMAATLGPHEYLWFPR